MSSVPSGGAVASGGGSAAAASGGAAPAAAAEEKKEEKAEEKASLLVFQRVHIFERYYRRSPTTTWASVSSTKSLYVYHVSIPLYCLSYLYARSMNTVMDVELCDKV